MKKDQVDLENAVVWIPDSKTPNGVAEVPLTPRAVQAFRTKFASRVQRIFGFMTFVRRTLLGSALVRSEPDASAERRKGLHEVLADEAADGKGEGF